MTLQVLKNNVMNSPNDMIFARTVSNQETNFSSMSSYSPTIYTENATLAQSDLEIKHLTAVQV